MNKPFLYKTGFMKKIIIAAIFISASFVSFAQESPKDNDEGTSGFKKQNLFTGGDLSFSYYNYTTGIGVSPIFGYSVNKWLDAGVVLNFNYLSEQVIDDNGYLTGDKIRQTDFGPGAFVRLYPVNFLFAQVQFEQNFITQKYLYNYGGTQTFNVNASSLLVGAGYCIGRFDGNGSPFIYVSIMADVLDNKYSPYVENVAGSPVILPIIRGGIQIPLFQGGNSSNRGYHRRHYHDDY
jgi:hypothetical protein